MQGDERPVDEYLRFAEKGVARKYIRRAPSWRSAAAMRAVSTWRAPPGREEAPGARPGARCSEPSGAEFGHGQGRTVIRVKPQELAISR